MFSLVGSHSLQNFRKMGGGGGGSVWGLRLQKLLKSGFSVYMIMIWAKYIEQLYSQFPIFLHKI